MLVKIKKIILDILFPKFCFNCKKEGSYLCEDCRSVLGVLQFHQKYDSKILQDLYFALPYQGPLIKNLIQKFKYRPFIKELAIPLTSLIIEHFQLLDNKLDFTDFILIPVPLEKKKLKQRGFNQAEEIGKELACFLKIPLIPNCLVKTKKTLAQMELSEEKRKENLKDAFSVNIRDPLSDSSNRERVSDVSGISDISGKKILLVDDVCTTGSTMEECARCLKAAGAKEIIGITVARG